MMKVKFEQLDPIKMPLVKRFYKSYYPSAKAKKDELTITAIIENSIQAVVRFRAIEQYRLMTGMLVAPMWRQQGLAHQLMAHCQHQQLNDHDYCFAYSHLEGFYAQHGFVTIPKQMLPNCLLMLFERYSNSGKDLIPMHYAHEVTR